MRIDELPWEKHTHPSLGTAQLYRNNTYISVYETGTLTSQTFDGVYHVWLNDGEPPRYMNALELQCLLCRYFPSNPEEDTTNEQPNQSEVQAGP
jgi:hypothetical protein